MKWSRRERSNCFFNFNLVRTVRNPTRTHCSFIPIITNHAWSNSIIQLIILIVTYNPRWSAETVLNRKILNIFSWRTPSHYLHLTEIYSKDVSPTQQFVGDSIRLAGKGAFTTLELTIPMPNRTNHQQTFSTASILPDAKF